MIALHVLSGKCTPRCHRLLQVHSRITFQPIALDAEWSPVSGSCDRADQPSDIVVAAAERLNQRVPIPSVPIRSVDGDPIQPRNGRIQQTRKLRIKPGAQFMAEIEGDTHVTSPGSLGKPHDVPEPGQVKAIVWV